MRLCTDTCVLWLLAFRVPASLQEEPGSHLVDVLDVILPACISLRHPGWDAGSCRNSGEAPRGAYTSSRSMTLIATSWPVSLSSLRAGGAEHGWAEHPGARRQPPQNDPRTTAGTLRQPGTCAQARSHAPAVHVPEGAPADDVQPLVAVRLDRARAPPLPHASPLSCAGGVRRPGAPSPCDLAANSRAARAPPAAACWAAQSLP